MAGKRDHIFMWKLLYLIFVLSQELIHLHMPGIDRFSMGYLFKSYMCYWIEQTYSEGLDRIYFLLPSTGPKQISSIHVMQLE